MNSNDFFLQNVIEIVINDLKMVTLEVLFDIVFVKVWISYVILGCLYRSLALRSIKNN